MLILNDTHIGFQRKGGTTPESREAMRSYLHKGFEDILYDTDEEHLVIVGDLFDDFEVAPRDWLFAFQVLNDWLARAKYLTLIAGNHDHSPKALRVSSFEMLAAVLHESYGDRVKVVPINGTTEVEPSVFAVAHCENQEAFELRLTHIHINPVVPKVLMLHCNYDNKFAAQSDHSLNLSPEMAQKLIDRGIWILIAHEHQAKRALGGKVLVLGNQWPTSIADCLGNDNKFAHVLRLEDGGFETEFELQEKPTWKRDDKAARYCEINWQNLCGIEACTETGFYRVVGEATAAQAAEVVNEIAAFRTRTAAFVVSNAVKVDGVVAAEELPEAFEAAKRFDVLEFINKHLDTAEVELVRKLIAEVA